MADDKNSILSPGVYDIKRDDKFVGQLFVTSIGRMVYFDADEVRIFGTKTNVEVRVWLEKKHGEDVACEKVGYIIRKHSPKLTDCLCGLKNRYCIEYGEIAP